MELWQLDATELARLIRVGQASSREAVGACLARMDAVNEKLNAVVRRMDDEALAAADAADAGAGRRARATAWRASDDQSQYRSEGPSDR